MAPLLSGLVVAWLVGLALWKGASEGGFIGFMAWDGGVNRMYRAGVTPLPRHGHNTLYAGLILGTLVAGVVTCVVLARRRTARLGGWRWPLAAALGLPWAMVAMAVVALALDAAGLWRTWMVRETALMHLGRRFDEPWLLRLWGTFALLWAVAALANVFWLRRRRHPWHAAAWSSAAANISALVLWGWMGWTVSSYRRFDGGVTVGWFALLALVATVLQLSWLLVFPPRHVLWLWAHVRSQRILATGVCSACGYDLRGTLAAGRSACPECGAAVTPASVGGVSATPALPRR